MSCHDTRADLERLLSGLFDAAGLRRWLSHGPEGEVLELELPAPLAPLRDLVHAAVGLLLRRGLVDTALFRRLQEEFPHRREHIGEALGRWVVARPAVDACASRRLSDSATAVQDALDAAEERRERCLIRGEDANAIDREIVELRRKGRQGPELKAGESVLAGRYRLAERVGSGGFATVWRAYDRELRTAVAIKLLHHQWGREPSYRERFARGARAMLRLRHPGIVKVLREVVEEDGFVFYVMEFVEGSNLNVAALRGDLDVDATLRACADASEALAFAHGHGIVHRDVKPSNILIDSRGQVLISDFDLLKGEHTTGGTRTGAGVGTLFFSAPEALSDAGRVDARADRRLSDMRPLASPSSGWPRWTRCARR